MSHPWRADPKLEGKLHPEYPDDLQVICHDGGPRLTKQRPELVWVRISACRDNSFVGQVLNQPHELTAVGQGSQIEFLVPDTGPHAVMVTSKYLAERPNWIIHPCNKCGNSELLDAPSDLVQAIFPELPEGSAAVVFTTFCGICGGVQVVQHKDAEVSDKEPPQAAIEQPSRNPWCRRLFS